MTGIYQIQNTINNKIYIGSSFNIYKRIAAHKILLKSNKHHSIHLQNAWNKYNDESVFEISVLEECDHTILLEREQYYMNTLLKADEYLKGESKYFLLNGYNICPLSIKGFTGKHSKKSIVQQLKNRGIYDEIYQIDIEGNILYIYDMFAECPDRRESILLSEKNKNTLKGKNYGYIRATVYKEGYKPSLYKPWNKGQKCPSNIGSEVYVYDIYNRFFKKFITIKKCADYFSTNSASICRKLKIKTTKLIGSTNIVNYHFYYKEQDEQISIIELSNIGNIAVYTVFNEFVGYSNINELVLKLEVHNQSIKSVLKNNRNQIKGYILKYHNDIV